MCHPVHLTRSAPFDVDAGQLVFYDVIDRSVLSRSSVLTCVAEAGGDAKLPDSITISEFRTWLSAVTNDPVEFQSRPFSFICTAIKVGDAVDDTHVNEWIQSAATVLRQSVVQPKSNDIEGGIIEGLSILPGHLQHRVFEEAAFDPQDLARLLTSFPTPLHGAVLHSTTTPDKTLRVPLDDTFSLACKALACPPAFPQSVLSLQVDQPDQPPRLIAPNQPETSPQLAQALRHHSGLTSLLLPSSVVSTAHTLLFPAIATLKSLLKLELTGPYVLQPQRAAVLKQTLDALPRLQDLKLQISNAGVDAPNCRSHGRERQRGEDPPITSQVCLADLLSPATALTSFALRVCAVNSAPYPSDCVLTATTPLVLPRLVALVVIGYDVRLAAEFFTRFLAPLTSLVLSPPLPAMHGLPPDAARCAQRLLSSLAAFTQLRTLCTGFDDHGSDGVHAALTSALPPLLTALHHLRNCTLVAAPAAMHCAVPALAAAAPSLTQLCLRSPELEPSRPLPESAAAAASWDAFFSALRGLQLQELELCVNRSFAPERHGLESLWPLTQLTALLTRGWNCLTHPEDAEALARMTRLRHLHLEHEPLWVPGECIAALRVLGSLTALHITTAPARSGIVLDLVESVPPAALAALQELTLAVYDPLYNARDLAAYAAALPALRRLTVCILPARQNHDEVMYGDDSEGGGVDALRARLREAEACLKEAAGSTPFQLVLDLAAFDGWL